MLIKAIAARAPSLGFQLRRLTGQPTSLAAAVPGSIAAQLLPPWRREGRLIGLASVVIVLFITGAAGLIVRKIDEASRTSNQEHVEQLLKAVTYQLGTMLVGIQQTIHHSAAEIRKANTPQRLVELAAEGQVPTHLLKRFFFIDPHGRVVANGMEESKEVTRTDLSNREYFRVHLNNPSKETRIGRPFHGLTGVELIPVSQAVYEPNGELMGVLVAMIGVETLGRIWLDIGFRPDDSIELIGEDNTVWFRWSKSPIADSASSNGMAWSRDIPGWPMSVVARLDQTTIDRHSLAAKQRVVGTAAAGSLIVGLFCVLLANRARQTVRQHDASEAMRIHLLAAIDAVPVEFLEFDRESRLILINRAARDASPWVNFDEYMGKTQAEFLRATMAHFRDDDPGRDWETWIDRRVDDFERGGVFETQRGNGKWRQTSVSLRPDGSRILIRTDITELKKRMERLNSVFESSGAGILLLDRDVRVVLVNQFLLDVLGKTADEIVGQPYAGLSVAGLDPAVIERWQNASGAERLRAVEFERSLPGADGTKHIIKVTANPVQDETGHLHYIVLIGVDDTERRLAEIRLFDSARLATLGEMATGMAHEINQPLAVIRMAADSLLDELEAPEAAALPAELAEFVRAKLARISSQTERASSLVNELRTVARKPTNDSLPFDVAEAVRVAKDLLHEQLKAARIVFTLDLPPLGLMARGEASRLQQVIINVVLNARDALLDDAGRPSNGTLGHIALRLVTAPADGGAVLTIEDDGPGIPAQVLPRLFEPFFTTKPTGKGTGLGLSISYDIIKRMGGNITAENRPEGGARFRIVLPLLHQALPETRTAA